MPRNIRAAIRSWLIQHPALYLPLARRKYPPGPDSGAEAVCRETQLVIEGYPRSANTYAEHYYNEWQIDMFYYGMPTYSSKSSKPFWPVRGGTHGSFCNGDFDTDGDVDGTDLVDFIEYHGGLSLYQFAGSFGKIACL